MTLPALRFGSEAFRLGKAKILGRQAAGYGLLRAILALPESAAITLDSLSNDNFNNEASFEDVSGPNAIGYVM